MTTQDKISITAIAKLAEDVRTIERFQGESVNDGFDPSLISASLIPGNNIGKKRLDWPLILVAIFSLIVLALSATNIIFEIPDHVKTLMLIASLLAGTFIVMCTQIRFKQIAVTIIAAIGLTILVAIAFGIITAEEAYNNANEFIK